MEKHYLLQKGIALLLLFLSISQFSGCYHKKENKIPEQTILFIIDGMACGTLERLSVPHLQELKKSGVYYPEVHLILPIHLNRNMDSEHPDYYPWGCSLPNVPLMSGTIFIGIDSLKNNLLPESFPERNTAFVVNDGAYDDLKHGFGTYHRIGASLEDQFNYMNVIEDAKNVIINKQPAFLRVHLQGTGTAGYFDYNSGTNIWADNSIYRQEVERADSVLGYFIDWLKKENRWDETVLIVMGDHGQNDEGWHAPYVGQANKQPVIFAGKSIKVGKTFDYAESIDICPTITYLNGFSPPKFCIGRPLEEIFIGKDEDTNRPQNIKKLNELLLKHHQLKATDISKDSLFIKLNGSFLTIENIGNWHKKFTDLESLINHQEEILTQLELLNKTTD